MASDSLALFGVGKGCRAVALSLCLLEKMKEDTICLDFLRGSKGQVSVADVSLPCDVLHRGEGRRVGVESKPQDSGLCCLLQLERKWAKLSYFAESS